jgi:hypothetical protein
MDKLQTNVNDIKSVAKNLKQELAKMDFKISHSSALNLASRSLGFKNYQTYKGLLDKKNNLTNGYEEFMEELEELRRKRYIEYPDIHHFFVKIGAVLKYDFFIYKEYWNYKSNYLILFEIKDSYTGRIFFYPKDDTFFIFKKYVSYIAYEYQIPKEKNIYYYFNMIDQVKEKSWATTKMVDDLMELIKNIVIDKEKLLKIVNRYSNKKLEELYNKAK